MLKKPSTKISAIIIATIGVLLLGWAGILFAQEQLFLQRAERASAAVTANTRYTYTGQINEYGVQHYYCSAFRFQTKDGREISFEENDEGGTPCADLDAPPDYQVGQQLPVYYDARDPLNSAQIPKEVQFSYKTVGVVAVGGALGVLIGLGLFWKDLLRRRPGIK
jgi:hypothetical protein